MISYDHIENHFSCIRNGEQVAWIETSAQKIEDIRGNIRVEEDHTFVTSDFGHFEFEQPHGNHEIKDLRFVKHLTHD